MTWLRTLALLVLAILPWAGAEAAEVEISDAWARASVGANGVAYFTAHNHGPATAIIGVASAAAETAALHGHAMDGEVMRMRPLERLVLAAGEGVTLAPGGVHVMLMRLVAPLVEGESLALTMRFDDGSETTVTVPVLAIAAMGPGRGAEPAPADGPGAPVTVIGVVNAIDAEARMVNLSHQAIPALGMPAMTMDLALSEAAGLHGISAGQRVMVILERGADGTLRIAEIMPAP